MILSYRHDAIMLRGPFRYFGKVSPGAFENSACRFRIAVLPIRAAGIGNQDRKDAIPPRKSTS